MLKLYLINSDEILTTHFTYFHGTPASHLKRKSSYICLSIFGSSILNTITDHMVSYTLLVPV